MFTETDLSTISIGDCWDNDFFSINGSRRIDNSMDNAAGTGPSVNQLALVGSNWQKDFIARNDNMVPTGLQIHTSSVPEPASALLLAFGMALLPFRRRKSLTLNHNIHFP